MRALYNLASDFAFSAYRTLDLDPIGQISGREPRWIGVELGGSAAFKVAAAAVHDAVRRHSQGSGDEIAASTACLPPTRWTLCLGVLRLYSPQQLSEVTAVLHEELSSEAAALRLGFEGLRCLGPTKVAATLAQQDAATLSELAARLHGRQASLAPQA